MHPHLTLVTTEIAPSEPPSRFASLRQELSDARRQLDATTSMLAAKQRECDDLIDALTEHAHRDALTGLFNRRKFDALCTAEIARHARYGEPLALMMLDIDHFKRINDDRGHVAGDAALVAVARVLSAQVRASDTSCRWGGEEFMILAPHTDLRCAASMAEKLCAAIAANDFGCGFPITCSIGVATMRDNDHVADLVMRVDACLYRAKRAGRNRVRAQSDGAGGTPSD